MVFCDGLSLEGMEVPDIAQEWSTEEVIPFGVLETRLLFLSYLVCCDLVKVTNLSEP